jgi:hypothetical protein
MKPTRYEITVRGRLSETLMTAFAGLEATPSAGVTVLHGEIADQPALFGVLERVESLGLELVEIRRTTEPITTEVPPCHPC